MPIEKKCLICGKSFLTYPSANYKTCSISCASKLRSIEARKKNLETLKKVKQLMEEGKSVEEVAKIMNLSKQTVYTLSTKVRKILKENLNFTFLRWKRESVWKRKLNPLELSYLAGIVDGEGTITLVIASNWRRKNKLLLRPTVIITNGNKELIDWIASFLKGTKIIDRRKIKGYKGGELYSLEFHSFPRVQSFLEEIYPYLKVKKKQAELLLKFIKSRQKGYSGSLGQYTPEEIKLFWSIRKLNLTQKRFSKLVERVKKQNLTILLNQLTNP